MFFLSSNICFNKTFYFAISLWNKFAVAFSYKKSRDDIDNNFSSRQFTVYDESKYTFRSSRPLDAYDAV